MSQNITVGLQLKYTADSQQFISSSSGQQVSAGVAMTGGYRFDVTGSASIFSMVMLPLNANFDTGSGIGNEAFKFLGFPGIASVNNTDSIPILDVNGLPLDFTTVSVLAFHVRSIDPDQPWGGTVNVTTANDVVPGNAFGREGIASECFICCYEKNGWEPGASG